MTIDERYAHAVEYLSTHYAGAKSELHYSTAFQLLTAVILSAQCTDKRVNLITPALFRAYPDAQTMAQATPEEIFALIHSCSYPKSKSRYLSEMSRGVMEMFGGDVPSSVEELQKLKGVGRKTANVVASIIFGADVMPVDTHVFRVAERIGLTTNSPSPKATEQTLSRHLKGILGDAHHWLLLHGRYTCTARNPKCAQCGLTHACRHYEKKKDPQPHKLRVRT